MKDFRDLRVWSKSHQLTLQIYAVTTNFPKCELYGLTTKLLTEMRKMLTALLLEIETERLMAKC